MTTTDKLKGFILILNVMITQSSFVYHENTNIIFQPDYSAEYFGYSTLLGVDGLLVGAPKAGIPSLPYKIKPGVVFNCSLNDFTQKNVNCTILRKVNGLRMSGGDMLRDDSWFGASIVPLSHGRLLINAPRWTSPYGKKHLLMNGASYIQTMRSGRFLYPLREINRQAYVTDGERREYGEYGTHLNFYAYGQSGMSAAVTKINTVILGAPGLLQWTGGIVSMAFNPDDSLPFMTKLPTANPYHTKDLGPDDYFGYSVGSGVFENNGETLYVAGAPRANIASGQVLIFKPPTQESDSLMVKAKVKGPQSGSYFGASLCCTDLNGDGLDDLLVGAPTFVKGDDWLPYDQGAVFVYITKTKESGFVLEEAGHVSGSGTNGAWFGNTIANLGDIDGDGHKDVAIGAPWENEGKGAVYIYKGCAKGLSIKNVQRIEPEGARGFGWSISNGFDVDSNNCSDLAIGAHNSQTTYLYRCIPTMQVHAVIKVPDAINLPQNTTGFTAVFCVSAPPIKFWPHVEINIIGKIEVDPESNRAMISGDSVYTVHVTPGKEICSEQTIEVNPSADLSKPISLIFRLEPDELMKENSTSFLMNAARLSENSTLKTSFLIQLVKDCGEDLICTPWLVMTLEALSNPYIPGSNTSLGARVTVFNKEEPAYGAKVKITLPMIPIRIPSECSLEDMVMECDVNALLREEEITWDIELDYNDQIIQTTTDTHLDLKAELSDPLYRNVTEEAVKELVINITPEANFSVSGTPMPNATVTVSRYDLAAGASVSFKHCLVITNRGPSDWPELSVLILPPNRTYISADISGCRPVNYFFDNIVNECVWTVPAKVSFPVYVPLQMNLSIEGDFLRQNITYNATTTILVRSKHEHFLFEVTTTLVLEPESVTWKLILFCVLLGLLLLGVIVFILYKRGFFQRTTHKMLQLQKDNQRLIQESENTSSQNEVEDDERPPEETDDEQ